MNAKLWEDTVVTAIRDEKWLHVARRWRAQNFTLPLPQVKLKSNAEQRLGDLIEITDDRFFLFEVKATRDDIEDEWHTNNREKGRQKDAFRTHRSWLKNLDDPKNKALINQSLLGHFFAYWVEHASSDQARNTPQERRGQDELVGIGECVAIEPYALACVSLRNTQPRRARVAKCLKDFKVAILNPKTVSFIPIGTELVSISPNVAPISIDDDVINASEFIVRQQVPLSFIYESSAYLIKEDHAAPWTTASHWQRLGLPIEEFESYLKILCGAFGNEAEPIHAVVLSASGNFFRIATNTSDLADILEPHPRPQPTQGEWSQQSRAALNPKKKDEWQKHFEQRKARAKDVNKMEPKGGP